MIVKLACLALALATACTSGGSSPPVPIDAHVEGITVPAVIRGTVPVGLTLYGDDGDPVDLRFEVSRDGGTTWRVGRITGGKALAATSVATPHTVQWDSLADAGFRTPIDLRIRITPVRGAARGTAAAVSAPTPDNRRLAAQNIATYMIHYGPFDDATRRIAETHDLVILHPIAGKLQPQLIREIQDGVDPADPADDVIVIAYISIGEDSRTVGVSDAQMLADPRFVGDGTGPRVDPRGPDADGTSLVGIDPLGIASNGGTGYASWYLDDNSIDRSATNQGDGKPDRNAFFGGCFVNAGDPKWFDVLDAMRFDGVDGRPGLRELLTRDYGRGYGCDGVFCDTVDTCAPNQFTDASSPNQSEFEWTAPGYKAFMKRIKEHYPEAFVLQNRGLFLYDPRHPHFNVNPRAYVDFVMFESFRLNSNKSEQFNPWFFGDNKYNIAPKLMAEAGRPDGFRVVSLGYAEGPSGAMDHATLLGKSDIGRASLLTDIDETQNKMGFLHYITNDAIAIANTFVRDHAAVDTTAPVWSSTYNDMDRTFPTVPLAPTPRVGIQRVITGPTYASVRWDVALDAHPVSYTLYYQPAPFDFTNDPNLRSAVTMTLPPRASSNYTAVGSGIYANEATVTGLTTGQRYWFCIRARDSLGHEEKNETNIAATPIGLTTIVIDGAFGDWATIPVAHTDPYDVADSAGPDWGDVACANDLQNLFLRFKSENVFNLDGSPQFTFSRTLIFIDTDDDPSTGYAASAAVGSELLIAGDSLFRQKRGTFNDGLLQPLSVNPKTGITECELAIPLQRILDAAPKASRIRLLFVNDQVNDYAPDAGYVEYRLIRG